MNRTSSLDEALRSVILEALRVRAGGIQELGRLAEPACYPSSVSKYPRRSVGAVDLSFARIASTDKVAWACYPVLCTRYSGERGVNTRP